MSDCERFEIRVTKDQLTFCSGHFISYEGDQCEHLHGHNYRTAVEAAGPLDGNGYVFDFIALKKMMREITEPLDHRMLLPARSRVIAVEELAERVRVRHRDREWIFPREDCAILPIENTTAELLARYIGQQLLASLSKISFAPDVLRIEIEESPGQSATWEWRT